ncbi:MAG: alkaline phosphatase family protein [Clostridia bacterium]|nr:alkaline phosphatase family protein [Clostridia bacterium]
MNTTSLDVVAASLCRIMGIEAPAKAAAPSPAMLEYADTVFEGAAADRVLMYNPDAIGQWIFEKYPTLFKEAVARTELQLPLRSPMPSVTPVCFASMYSGLQPEEHGIQKYEKPTLQAETVFDTAIRAGKKVAIVAYHTCTISKIFRERDMEYFTYGTLEEVHAKVAELIINDTYDLIVVHAWNYDSVMHKFGPESVEALSEARVNSEAYALLDALVQTYWTKHNVFMGFAMDHGCHEIGGDCGSHGLDMPEDLNIVHLYKAYKKKIGG